MLLKKQIATKNKGDNKLVSNTVALFILFILGSIAIAKLSATRDDALNAQRHHQ
jgi:preprotein translocase subunit SecG